MVHQDAPFLLLPTLLPARREPRLLVAIHLQLNSVLDLTNAAIRRKLGITLEEIREENWRKLQNNRVESLTQSLGRAAFESGAGGMDFWVFIVAPFSWAS